MNQVQYVLHDNYRMVSMPNYVTGHDRPLYFTRPLIQLMGETALFQKQPQNSQTQDIQTNNNNEPQMKSVEVQTKYRDEEAQTNPYSPDPIINGNKKPEVISETLLKMKYGNGLPVSINELEQIELSREKNWFELALPPISDESSFNLRRKLMEEQELREWKKKEDAIKKKQQEELNLLQSALIEREKDIEEGNMERVEEIKIKKKEQKNRLIAKIQRRKIKILRKLLKSRKDLDNDSQKREIIEEYANFGSKVYAGITRMGISLDKIANKYEVQPISLQTYDGISQLQKQLSPQIFNQEINVDSIKSGIGKQYTRLESQLKNLLQKAQDEINGLNQKQSMDMTEMRKYSLSKMQERPPTPQQFQNPELAVYSDVKQRAFQAATKEKHDNAVLLIQRLLRGRMIQNIMYEGKEKRLALIEELLTVAQIEDLSENIVQNILMEAHNERVQNALIEALQGDVISHTLDNLAKELLRFQQERKIIVMVEKAENDRKLREIEESGKRQAEETLRQREDVLYSQIMQVHQGTVDNYLNFMIDQTIEQSSKRQALMMTRIRKEKILDPVQDLERAKHNHETIIRDLMGQFLMPNVDRQQIQKQIAFEEKRYAETSKVIMQNTLQKVEKK